jgi:hypothetical protein
MSEKGRGERRGRDLQLMERAMDEMDETACGGDTLGIMTNGTGVIDHSRWA